MELSKEMQEFLITQVASLTGYAKRNFMANAVSNLLGGNQLRAEQELGWNRKTVRKALEEWDGGFCYIDRYHERGRKRAEAHLPNLLTDIAEIAEDYSQTDATFRTTRRYTRLSAAEMRQQLVEQKGYASEDLPSAETIREKLNQLGYGLKSVRKNQPVKKIPETDAIFAQVHQVNQAADADDTVLRISWDAKAPVPIGRFSRGGVSRVVVKALDHDFVNNADKLTPFGLFLPQYNELYLYFTPSKVTSDFIVDCLCDLWRSVKERFPQVNTLVINQDNGPENSTRRTQFMRRLTAFVDHFQIAIELACYPPYHSKYNPIERVWGVLEQHWNGSLLHSLDTILEFARSMTYNGQQPTVELVHKIYQTGLKLTQKQMKRLERRFDRLAGLEKWFVRIPPVFITHAG